MAAARSFWEQNCLGRSYLVGSYALGLQLDRQLAAVAAFEKQTARSLKLAWIGSKLRWKVAGMEAALVGAAAEKLRPWKISVCVDLRRDVAWRWEALGFKLAKRIAPGFEWLSPSSKQLPKKPS